MKDFPSKSEVFGTFDTLSDRLDDLDGHVVDALAGFGEGSDPVLVPSDGTETVVEVVDGVLTAKDFVIQPGNSTPFLRVPNPNDVRNQDLRILSSDGAQPASAYWVHESPTAGTAVLGQEIFVALLTAIGEGNSIDLTTATLGFPYEFGVDVDGTTSTGDPVNDVFGPMIAGDGYAELIRLIDQAAVVFIAAGCTIDQNTGTITSPTVGSGSSVAFSAGMTLAGVDLEATMATTAVDGINGTVYPAVDNEYGNLDVSTLPQYAGYTIIESGIHLHPNMRDLSERAVVLRAISANDNGGEIGRWASVGFPIRDSMIQINGWDAVVVNPAFSGAEVKTLNDLGRLLMNVGGLADGNYRLQLTRDSGGTNTFQWVEDV